jgi:hypothetical protein
VKEQQENMEEEVGRRGIPSLLKLLSPPETDTSSSLQQEHIASNITQVQHSLWSLSWHLVALGLCQFIIVLPIRMFFAGRICFHELVLV